MGSLAAENVPQPRLRRMLIGLYLRAILVVAACTFVAAVFFPYFSAENLSMIYLTGIVATALYYGRGPSILATIISVAAFDYFFTQPYQTFAIANVQNVLTLLVMLLVAVTISSLAARSRQQAELVKEREHRTASLYELNRKLSGAQGLQNLLDIAARHVESEFDSQTVIFSAASNGRLNLSSAQSAEQQSLPDLGIAEWAFTNGKVSGYSTPNIPGNSYLYLPFKALEKAVGVLCIYAEGKAQFTLPERRQFLQTLGDQLALAIERYNLAEEARQARNQAETERLRNSLLSSVSHDLRTPLASIMGAASALLEKGPSLDTKAHLELSQVAYEEAERLNRLVGNLLEMTRLESGGLKMEKEWQSLEEVVGAALHHLGKRRINHRITTNLPPSLPLIPMDAVLIEQVLVNLLDNAIKYAPRGTHIDVSAAATLDEVTIRIIDQGPGIMPGEQDKIFDKFYRSISHGSGVGLGLAICKGIIQAHSGRIWAENRPTEGAVFTIVLPLEGKQPELDEEL